MADAENIRKRVDSMQDQASRLREWVRQQSGAKAWTRSRTPGLVMVLGGRPGVGVTTVSANLAAALAAAGRQTVLLDADLRRPDATRLCRVQAPESLAEVILSGRTLREVVQPGPGGMYVVPGLRPGLKLPGDSRYASQRILEGIRGLGSLADMVVADVGGELSACTWSLWRAAQCVLAITTPENDVLMNTYAALKALTTQAGLASVHLVVNRANSEPEAEEIYERLARTSFRFLALPVSRAGFIPNDPRVETAGLTQGLLWNWTPPPDSATSIRRLAGYVAEAVEKVLGGKSPCVDSPDQKSSTPRAQRAQESVGPWAAPCWDGTSSVPPDWHVHTPERVGKLGFPVTISPSLDMPSEGNSKKG